MTTSFRTGIVTIVYSFFVRIYDKTHFGKHNRFGPGLGFDENTAEFGGYLTKEVPKQCFYSKLMGGLVCSYSD